MITRTALAVADGRDRLGTLAGTQFSIGAAVGLAALLLVVRLLLSLVVIWASSEVTVGVTATTRERLASAYLHADWATQQAETSGRLQELLMSFAGSATVIASATTTAMNGLLNLMALLVVSLLINPVATIAVAGSLAVLGSLLAPLRKRVRARARTAAAAQMAFAESISEVGALAMEMQAFGVREQFSERVNGLITADAGARRSVSLLQGSLAPVYTTLAYAALVGGVALASSVVEGELGGIAAVMLVMLRSLSYGQQAQVALGALGAAVPFVEQIDETAHHYETAVATGGQRVVNDLGSITLRSVTFAYEEGRDVLHDLSCSIAEGEVIGVIGPSGSGKSTLIQLLLGLRDPDAGTVEVGGIDLRQVDRQTWAELVAFVPQEPVLLSGPVSDSIAFCRPHISRETVELAAGRAHVADEIRALPDGFESMAGDRGTRLSGGQRQRVSIARALAGNPRLLVMDEPTSSLDSRSEALIRQTVAELKGSTTIVIIAHRLSTLDGCDRIMVLEHGYLKAFDTPQDLARDNAFYQEALALSGMSP